MSNDPKAAAKMQKYIPAAALRKVRPLLLEAAFWEGRRRCALHGWSSRENRQMEEKAPWGGNPGDLMPGLLGPHVPGNCPFCAAPQRGTGGGRWTCLCLFHDSCSGCAVGTRRGQGGESAQVPGTCQRVAPRIRTCHKMECCWNIPLCRLCYDSAMTCLPQAGLRLAPSRGLTLPPVVPGIANMPDLPWYVARAQRNRRENRLAKLSCSSLPAGRGYAAAPVV